MPSKTSSDSPRLETLRRAAERNSVSVDTIRRRIATGELKAYRLGKRVIRVDLADVDALFQPIPTTKRSRAVS
jgi:excisionase family DNA binding protein